MDAATEHALRTLEWSITGDAPGRMTFALGGPDPTEAQLVEHARGEAESGLGALIADGRVTAGEAVAWQARFAAAAARPQVREVGRRAARAWRGPIGAYVATIEPGTAGAGELLHDLLHVGLVSERTLERLSERIDGPDRPAAAAPSLPAGSPTATESVPALWRLIADQLVFDSRMPELGDRHLASRCRAHAAIGLLTSADAERFIQHDREHADANPRVPWPDAESVPPPPELARYAPEPHEGRLQVRSLVVREDGLELKYVHEPLPLPWWRALRLTRADREGHWPVTPTWLTIEEARDLVRDAGIPLFAGEPVPPLPDGRVPYAVPIFDGIGDGPYPCTASLGEVTVDDAARLHLRWHDQLIVLVREG